MIVDLPCEEKERSSPCACKQLSSKLGLAVIPLVGILKLLSVSADDRSISLPSTSLAFLGDSVETLARRGTAFLLIRRGDTPAAATTAERATGLS